jgi:hypothetical protein
MRVVKMMKGANSSKKSYMRGIADIPKLSVNGRSALGIGTVVI